MSGIILVRAALETALAAMSPALATAWQNVPYVPVNGTPYQRVHLLPVAPDNPTIGRFTTERGVFQVSLYYPLDTGPAAAEARAEAVREIFYRGASFTAGDPLLDGDGGQILDGDGNPIEVGFIATIIERTPEIAPALIADDRYVVPVRVRFYAHRES